MAWFEAVKKELENPRPADTGRMNLHDQLKIDSKATGSWQIDILNTDKFTRTETRRTAIELFREFQTTSGSERSPAFIEKARLHMTLLNLYNNVVLLQKKRYPRTKWMFYLLCRYVALEFEGLGPNPDPNKCELNYLVSVLESALDKYFEVDSEIRCKVFIVHIIVNTYHNYQIPRWYMEKLAGLVLKGTVIQKQLDDIYSGDDDLLCVDNLWSNVHLKYFMEEDDFATDDEYSSDEEESDFLKSMQGDTKMYPSSSEVEEDDDDFLIINYEINTSDYFARKLNEISKVHDDSSKQGRRNGNKGQVKSSEPNNLNLPTIWPHIITIEDDDDGASNQLDVKSEHVDSDVEVIDCVELLCQVRRRKRRKRQRSKFINVLPKPIYIEDDEDEIAVIDSSETNFDVQKSELRNSVKLPIVNSIKDESAIELPQAISRNNSKESHQIANNSEFPKKSFKPKETLAIEDNDYILKAPKESAAANDVNVGSASIDVMNRTSISTSDSLLNLTSSTNVKQEAGITLTQPVVLEEISLKAVKHDRLNSTIDSQLAKVSSTKNISKVENGISQIGESKGVIKDYIQIERDQTESAKIQNTVINSSENVEEIIITDDPVNSSDLKHSTVVTKTCEVIQSLSVEEKYCQTDDTLHSININTTEGPINTDLIEELVGIDLKRSKIESSVKIQQKEEIPRDLLQEVENSCKKASKEHTITVIKYEDEIKLSTKNDPCINDVEQSDKVDEEEEGPCINDVEKFPKVSEVEEGPCINSVEKSGEVNEDKEGPCIIAVENSAEVNEEEDPCINDVKKSAKVNEAEEGPCINDVEKSAKVNEEEEDPYSGKANEEGGVLWINDVEKSAKVNEAEEGPCINNVEKSSKVNEEDEGPCIIAVKVNEEGHVPCINDVEKSAKVNEAEYCPCINDVEKSAKVNEEEEAPCIIADENSGKVNEEEEVPCINDVEKSDKVNEEEEGPCIIAVEKSEKIIENKVTDLKNQKDGSFEFTCTEEENIVLSSDRNQEPLLFQTEELSTLDTSLTSTKMLKETSFQEAEIVPSNISEKSSECNQNWLKNDQNTPTEDCKITIDKKNYVLTEQILPLQELQLTENPILIDPQFEENVNVEISEKYVKDDKIEKTSEDVKAQESEEHQSKENIQDHEKSNANKLEGSIDTEQCGNEDSSIFASNESSHQIDDSKSGDDPSATQNEEFSTGSDIIEESREVKVVELKDIIDTNTLISSEIQHSNTKVIDLSTGNDLKQRSDDLEESISIKHADIEGVEPTITEETKSVDITNGEYKDTEGKFVDAIIEELKNCVVTLTPELKLPVETAFSQKCENETIQLQLGDVEASLNSGNGNLQIDEMQEIKTENQEEKFVFSSGNFIAQLEEDKIEKTKMLKIRELKVEGLQKIEENAQIVNKKSPTLGADEIISETQIVDDLTEKNSRNINEEATVSNPEDKSENIVNQDSLLIDSIEYLSVTTSSSNDRGTIGVDNEIEESDENKLKVIIEETIPTPQEDLFGETNILADIVSSHQEETDIKITYLHEVVETHQHGDCFKERDIVQTSLDESTVTDEDVSSTFLHENEIADLDMERNSICDDVKIATTSLLVESNNLVGVATEMIDYNDTLLKVTSEKVLVENEAVMLVESEVEVIAEDQVVEADSSVIQQNEENKSPEKITQPISSHKLCNHKQPAKELLECNLRMLSSEAEKKLIQESRSRVKFRSTKHKESEAGLMVRNKPQKKNMTNYHMDYILGNIKPNESESLPKGNGPNISTGANLNIDSLPHSVNNLLKLNTSVDIGKRISNLKSPKKDLLNITEMDAQECEEIQNTISIPVPAKQQPKVIILENVVITPKRRNAETENFAFKQNTEIQLSEKDEEIVIMSDDSKTGVPSMIVNYEEGEKFSLGNECENQVDNSVEETQRKNKSLRLTKQKKSKGTSTEQAKEKRELLIETNFAPESTKVIYEEVPNISIEKNHGENKLEDLSNLSFKINCGAQSSENDVFSELPTFDENTVHANKHGNNILTKLNVIDNVLTESKSSSIVKSNNLENDTLFECNENAIEKYVPIVVTIESKKECKDNNVETSKPLKSMEKNDNTTKSNQICSKKIYDESSNVSNADKKSKKSRSSSSYYPDNKKHIKEFQSEVPIDEDIDSNTISTEIEMDSSQHIALSKTHNPPRDDQSSTKKIFKTDPKPNDNISEGMSSRSPNSRKIEDKTKIKASHLHKKEFSGNSSKSSQHTDVLEDINKPSQENLHAHEQVSAKSKTTKSSRSSKSKDMEKSNSNKQYDKSKSSNSSHSKDGNRRKPSRSQHEISMTVDHDSPKPKDETVKNVKSKLTRENCVGPKNKDLDDGSTNFKQPPNGSSEIKQNSSVKIIKETSSKQKVTESHNNVEVNKTQKNKSTESRVVKNIKSDEHSLNENEEKRTSEVQSGEGNSKVYNKKGEDQGYKRRRSEDNKQETATKIEGKSPHDVKMKNFKKKENQNVKSKEISQSKLGDVNLKIVEKIKSSKRKRGEDKGDGANDVTKSEKLGESLKKSDAVVNMVDKLLKNIKDCKSMVETEEVKIKQCNFIEGKRNFCVENKMFENEDKGAKFGGENKNWGIEGEDIRKSINQLIASNSEKGNKSESSEKCTQYKMSVGENHSGTSISCRNENDDLLRGKQLQNIDDPNTLSNSSVKVEDIGASKNILESHSTNSKEPSVINNVAVVNKKTEQNKTLLNRDTSLEVQSVEVMKNDMENQNETTTNISRAINKNDNSSSEANFTHNVSSSISVEDNVIKSKSNSIGDVMRKTKTSERRSVEEILDEHEIHISKKKSHTDVIKCKLDGKSKEAKKGYVRERSKSIENIINSLRGGVSVKQEQNDGKCDFKPVKCTTENVAKGEKQPNLYQLDPQVMIPSSEKIIQPIDYLESEIDGGLSIISALDGLDGVFSQNPTASGNTNNVVNQVAYSVDICCVSEMSVSKCGSSMLGFEEMPLSDEIEKNGRSSTKELSGTQFAVANQHISEASEDVFIPIVGKEEIIAHEVVNYYSHEQSNPQFVNNNDQIKDKFIQPSVMSETTNSLPTVESSQQNLVPPKVSEIVTQLNAQNHSFPLANLGFADMEEGIIYDEAIIQVTSSLETIMNEKADFIPNVTKEMFRVKGDSTKIEKQHTFDDNVLKTPRIIPAALENVPELNQRETTSNEVQKQTATSTKLVKKRQSEPPTFSKDNLVNSKKNKPEVGDEHKFFKPKVSNETQKQDVQPCNDAQNVILSKASQPHVKLPYLDVSKSKIKVENDASKQNQRKRMLSQAEFEDMARKKIKPNIIGQEDMNNYEQAKYKKPIERRHSIVSDEGISHTRPSQTRKYTPDTSRYSKSVPHPMNSDKYKYPPESTNNRGHVSSSMNIRRIPHADNRYRRYEPDHVMHSRITDSSAQMDNRYRHRHNDASNKRVHNFGYYNSAPNRPLYTGLSDSSPHDRNWRDSYLDAHKYSRKEVPFPLQKSSRQHHQQQSKEWYENEDFEVLSRPKDVIFDIKKTDDGRN